MVEETEERQEIGTVLIGEKVKSIITGKIYEVKMIRGMSIVLESEDRKSQILTEHENLKFFYIKVEPPFGEKRPEPLTF